MIGRPFFSLQGMKRGFLLLIKIKYMKNGFSLIETIVYISLLSLLLLGVFSSILSFTYSKRELIDQNDYEFLIENYHEK